MTSFSIRYKSTNFYFIDTGSGLLAFDAGWPDTYREYKEGLKYCGYGIADIKWMIVSHFHMDHAGLAGMLLDKGVRFFVFENQVQAIEEMESLISNKNMTYHLIDREKLTEVAIDGSRKLLESIGVNGEVIQTDGHGAHSITLLLDTGEAFIGDLPPENMVGDADVKSKNNWQILRSRGARLIKPAHAMEYETEMRVTRSEKKSGMW